MEIVCFATFFQVDLPGRSETGQPRPKLDPVLLHPGRQGQGRRRQNFRRLDFSRLEWPATRTSFQGYLLLPLGFLRPVSAAWTLLGPWMRQTEPHPPCLSVANGPIQHRRKGSASCPNRWELQGRRPTADPAALPSQCPRTE